ncbi:type II secretion system protein [Candidatus Peregrinibacteria bacterium]|nr:type II secretion system protein [Candidatus Peregrinibacteria bacterium]
MKKFLINKRGFTLVEMLVAMAIFVTFTAILIGSYQSIVKAQREANEYRLAYVEARQVFETMVAELRDGMIDYGSYPEDSFSNDDSVNEWVIVSKDARSRTVFRYINGDTLQFNKQTLSPDQKSGEGLDSLNGALTEPENFVNLNSEVKVTDFRLKVTPVIDPYDIENFDKHLNQFHPKVTIYAHFVREFANGTRSYEMDLQTTVSSRIYNQVYAPK